jgi:hypothetical protein
MACRNDDAADPVGRGRGVPLPPPKPPPEGRPCGGVTPCCSRHFLKAELCDVPCDVPCDVLCDVPEPESDPAELVPQPATARVPVKATAPSTVDLGTRRSGLRSRRRPRVLSGLRGRRIKRFLLAAVGRLACRDRPGRAAALPDAVKGAGLAISLWLPDRFLCRSTKNAEGLWPFRFPRSPAGGGRGRSLPGRAPYRR